MQWEFLPKGFFAPCQVHEAEISCIDAQQQDMLGKDALVTDIPDSASLSLRQTVSLVLVYAPDKKVVAAIHAGWRGTVKQIVAKTICCMADRYSCDPALMMAGIAPSISKEAFEVGEEVVDAFRETGVDMNRIMERNAQTGKSPYRPLGGKPYPVAAIRIIAGAY